MVISEKTIWFSVGIKMRILLPLISILTLFCFTGGCGYTFLGLRYDFEPRWLTYFRKQTHEKPICQVIEGDSRSDPVTCRKLIDDEPSVAEDAIIGIKWPCNDYVFLPVRLDPSSERSGLNVSVPLLFPWDNYEYRGIARARRKATGKKMYFSGKGQGPLGSIQFADTFVKMAIANEEIDPKSSHSYDLADFRQNTLVEQLGKIPDEQGECSLSIVRIVDSGDNERWHGKLFVIPENELSEEMFGKRLTPQEQIKAEQARQAENQKHLAEEQQKERREITEQEAASGTCDDSRSREFQKLLNTSLPWFFKMYSALGRVSILFNEIGVVAEKGDSFLWRNGMPGRYIFLVLGYSPIEIAVENSNGKASMIHQGYDELLKQKGWNTHNRVMRLNALQEQSITVTGKGCYLFIAGTLGERY